MNIAEYVETEFSDFAEKEFSAVDSLVLSQLSYFSFKGVIPGMERRAKAARMKDIYKLECLPEMIKMVRFPKENMRLIAALAGSPRFRDIKIRYYVNEVDEEMEKQFSAMCFILDKRTAYIAFRGTDATFTGWKEDFNMVLWMKCRLRPGLSNT